MQTDKETLNNFDCILSMMLTQISKKISETEQLALRESENVPILIPIQVVNREEKKVPVMIKADKGKWQKQKKRDQYEEIVAENKKRNDELI